MGDANEIYKPQPMMTRIHAKSNKVVNGFVGKKMQRITEPHSFICQDLTKINFLYKLSLVLPCCLI